MKPSIINVGVHQNVLVCLLSYDCLTRHPAIVAVYSMENCQLLLKIITQNISFLPQNVKAIVSCKQYSSLNILIIRQNLLNYSPQWVEIQKVLNCLSQCTSASNIKILINVNKLLLVGMQLSEKYKLFLPTNKCLSVFQGVYISKSSLEDGLRSFLSPPREWYLQHHSHFNTSFKKPPTPFKKPPTPNCFG